MIKKILIFLLFAFPAAADTGMVYLQGCEGGQVTLAWFVPNPTFGTHKVGTTPGWFVETPLYAAQLEFLDAFKRGCYLEAITGPIIGGGDPTCYKLTLDVDLDGFTDTHDYDILVERWQGNPAIIGTHSIIPARDGIAFPPKACVKLTWTPQNFTPLMNLYQACFVDGKIVSYPEGQWVGPAIPSSNSPCESGIYNEDGTVSPPPVNVPPSPAAITGLALWDAITDTVLDPDFTNGDTISSSCVSIEIKANAYVQANGSVGKVLDNNGNMLCENYSPYAWEDDAGVGQFNCAPTLTQKGQHILTVIPFEGKGCIGPTGPPVSTSFTVN